MRTLIVEDRAYIRKGLINFLERVEGNYQVIGECESVNDAVIVAKSCTPDLVFLDINLLDGTAFDFLEQTKTLFYKVIFITAYEEYALRALKIGAVDYLLKPVDLEELKMALKKLENLSISQQQQQIDLTKQVWNNKGKKIILSLQDSFQIIDLNKLIFCQSDKGYTSFYTTDKKKYLASKTLKEFEEQLSQFNFIRPHQSYMVNLNFIDKYDKSGTIFMINGEKIPVSFRKRDDFLKKFLSFEGE